MYTSQTKPVVVRSGEGRKIHQVQGDPFTLLLSGEETNGTFVLMLEEATSGEGPPLHVHHREDEIAYVLEGNVEFQVGEERFTVSAGSTVFLPRGIPHSYRYPGPGITRVLFWATPAGFEGFFIEVEALGIANEPNMTAIIDIAGKYGVEVVGAPMQA